MNQSAFPSRVFGVVGVMALLSLVLTVPAGAFSPLLQNTPEPTPRDTPTVVPSPTLTYTPSVTPSPTWTPSPTPTPYIELDPTQAVGNQEVTITVSGYYWRTDGPGVTLAWDQFDGDHWLVGPFQPNADGSFRVVVRIKKAWATPGMHKVIASDNVGFFAEAFIELITPTTAPPTNTPTRTPTLTPSPTLHPITPMVTITPIPPTPRPTAWATSTPRPTSTNTPLPGTLTFTPTPSITPTPTDTPGPGTPSATPEATSTPTPTPVEEISDTGGGWGTVFLWGFVLAGLLVVFRLLRVRSLPGRG